MWVQHPTSMEQMRLGIGLHAYGQRDPLVMYRQEGHSMFQGFLDQVRHQIANSIFNITVQSNTTGQSNNSKQILEHGKSPGSTGHNHITVKEKPLGKIGRNDPCHCGSGLKFKRCHGKSA